MKKVFLFISLFILIALACDLSVTVAPSTSPAPLSTNTALPATSVPNATPTEIPASATMLPATAIPTALPPTSEEVEVSIDPLSLVLSPELASGARGLQIPRAEGQNVAPWEVTPGHTILKLEGYRLPGKSQPPQIYVYPAQAYAELYPGAFESLHRLDNLLGNPGAPISAEQLPAVPFFNAQQAFASQIQVVSFQNGRGVRFLTEYAQYPVSANNQDLFYQFQGLTSDGAYYIIAILPISNPNLAETSDPGAALPPAGVPYLYYANPNADMPGYYSAVTVLLNAAPQETFTPTLNQLDLLIQSMRITQ
jgi:hypothetical protein